jgi:hypothetical protein
MTDPIATAARSAAKHLSAEYGPGLATEVEGILLSQRRERPRQYLDPVSLSSLIVSIATLAWTVYADLKKQASDTSAEDVARTVRIELPDQTTLGPADRDRIITVVVTEVVRAADDPH